jgi:hypothetical protein
MVGVHVTSYMLYGRGGQGHLCFCLITPREVTRSCTWYVSIQVLSNCFVVQGGVECRVRNIGGLFNVGEREGVVRLNPREYSRSTGNRRG